VKIGVIGLGDIARKAYLPLLAQMPGVEPVLCTRSGDVLRRLAGQYRINATCDDYRELPALGIDAVMIHSATAAHGELAGYFLQQGLPTFVDKPLADSAAACERLYDVAARCAQPLYVGFNRRHLPLLSQQLPGLLAGSRDDLRALRWEKHRHNLAGDARTFLFDDFIHALDSVNLNARAALDGAFVSLQRSGAQLARIDVHWQCGDTLLQASMDRRHGITRERVSVDLDNCSYEFDSFTSGRRQRDNAETRVALPDWTPMLAAKGFAAMLDDWLGVVQRGQLATHTIARNIASHRLAEALCARVQRAGAATAAAL